MIFLLMMLRLSLASDGQSILAKPKQILVSSDGKTARVYFFDFAQILSAQTNAPLLDCLKSAIKKKKAVHIIYAPGSAEIKDCK